MKRLIVGLRDGLLDRSYREDEYFVLGVRCTQGDLTALTDAARALVSYEVDLIGLRPFTTGRL